MKHLGNITNIDGHNVPLVDIITGGSPCQDLSVAGKREGLAGERSGLFMEQIRIVKEMRDESISRLQSRGSNVDLRCVQPRYMVWENVPGAFSSNKGEDFRAVLEETAKIADEGAVIPKPLGGKWTPAGCIMGSGWSIAWRVHDAQFWGVPQRRKRIALVADFGGQSAPEILFERKGVSRDIEESGEEGKGATANTERSVDKAIVLNDQGGSQMSVSENVSSCLRAQEHGHQPCVVIEGNGRRESHKGDGYKESDVMYTLNTVEQHAVCFEPGSMSRVGGHYYEDDKSGTLRANAGDNQMAVCIENHPADSRVKISEDGIVQTLSSRMGTGGGNVPMVMEQPISLTTEMTPKVDENGVAFSLRNRDYKDPQSVCVEDRTYQNTTGSLCASGYSKLGTQEALNDMYVIQNSSWDGSQTAPTLTANNANGSQRMPDKDNFNAVITYQNTVGALCARDYKGIGSQYVSEDKCITQSVVRRLTPLECERLQGYPDGWTNIGEWIDTKGKEHKDADSPRYKALGNSIALPFWEWMAGRMIKALNKENPTMASLFDGIGGFPLVYSRCGCKPIWASEIEEFPIAVTKIRFKEDE